MTSNSAVTQRVLDAMEPGKEYQYRDLRALEALRGAEDHQIRNALISLQKNERIRKRGRRVHYRYSLNPNPPKVKAGAATLAFNAKPVIGPVAPATDPAWPAIRPAVFGPTFLLTSRGLELRAA